MEIMPSSHAAAVPASAGTRYRDALALLATAQKSSAGAPAYSRWVNRRAGRRLAAAAYCIGLTPNMVTVLSAAFTYCGIVLLLVAPPSTGVGIAVAATLVVGYALDSADGQLARLRGGGSLFGEWLDHMVDCIKETGLHLAVLVSAFRYFDLSANGWLLIPLGYTLVAVARFYGVTLVDQLRKSRGTLVPSGNRLSNSPLTAAALLPTDYGLLCLIFVLLGHTTLFFAVYAALFACNGVFLMMAMARWGGQLRRIDGESADLRDRVAHDL